jgi:hypothetical protein
MSSFKDVNEDDQQWRSSADGRWKKLRHARSRRIASASLLSQSLSGHRHWILCPLQDLWLLRRVLALVASRKR